MRLGTLTLSTTLSAFLLSGCSFINGQKSQHNNPYAKHQAAQYGQYGAQNCQIATPRQPIPNGCRPEQVTIGVASQTQGYGGANYSTNGFPQQPQFGQPQYTDGAYGAAVGQTAAVAHRSSSSNKRKPKLRGSLTVGADPSISGKLIDYGIRDDLNPGNSYNPQDFNLGRTEGSIPEGLITRYSFTANESVDALNAHPRDADGRLDIYRDNGFEGVTTSDVLFEDAYSIPINIKGGLEYILNDKTTVFANGGYTSADGQTRSVSTVTATAYRRSSAQNYDGDGNELGGAVVSTTFDPNHTIASFSQNFSDVEQYDLEVGARHYLNPLVKSQGYRTVTPFVGASVGLSHVNAVDVTTSQQQVYYSRLFDEDSQDLFFDVPSDSNSTRIFDAQWLPQAQLNVGAEWQVTPGFALAAESGLKVQGAREYADFTNADGDEISGKKGETNVSIPLTLRGSVNF